MKKSRKNLLQTMIKASTDGRGGPGIDKAKKAILKSSYYKFLKKQRDLQRIAKQTGLSSS
jgi:hypothetical protein